MFQSTRTSKEKMLTIAAERAAAAGLIATPALTEDGERIFYVRSRSQSRGQAFHVIHQSHGRWQCRCPFACSWRGTTGGEFCAHLGAVFAWWRAHQTATPASAEAILAKTLASHKPPPNDPPPPPPRRPRRRTTSTQEAQCATTIPTEAIPTAIARALTAVPGRSHVDNLLALARRTFRRQCETIINKQTMLQTLPRSRAAFD